MVRSKINDWLRREGGKEEAWNWLERQRPEVRGRVLDELAGNLHAPISVEMLRALKEHVTKNQWHAQRLIAQHKEELIEEYGFADIVEWAAGELDGTTGLYSAKGLLDGANGRPLDDVVAVYEQLPAGVLRDSTAKLIGRRMSEHDPVAALAWINAQGMHRKLREEAVKGWATDWAHQGRGGVAEFLNNNEPSNDSAALLKATVASFSKRDPTAGAMWLGELARPEQAVEAATAMFALWGADVEQRDAAMAAAESLQDQAVRQAAIGAIGAIGGED